jgi:hypothetical protein
VHFFTKFYEVALCYDFFTNKNFGGKEKKHPETPKIG